MMFNYFAIQSTSYEIFDILPSNIFRESEMLVQNQTFLKLGVVLHLDDAFQYVEIRSIKPVIPLLCCSQNVFARCQDEAVAGTSVHAPYKLDNSIVLVLS